MVIQKMPLLKLFCRNGKVATVSASGHIHVLDLNSGNILCTTATNEEQGQKVLKSGLPVAAAVDDSFSRLVVASSDKTVRVWNLNDLSLVSEREVPKKPTDVCLSRDGKKVFVSDKFGDVHSYSSDASVEANEASTSSNAIDEKKPKRSEDDTLLLGHVSLLTTLLLTKDERYIVTADRDEHIRISWYPEAYCIERFCLGHKKFVSALHIPASDPSLLVSGGGDPELRVWDWMEGKTLFHIHIADAVVPHIKVKRRKTKEAGDEGEGEAGELRMSSRKKRKQVKKAKKESETEGLPDTKADEADEGMVVDDPGHDDVIEEDDSETAPVLAIQKILTVTDGSSEYIIFSAHGASALFFCSFPTQSDALPSVHAVALSHPVLDFELIEEKSEVWAAVDVSWSSDSASQPDDCRPVHCLGFSHGVFQASDTASHVTLSSINSAVCSQSPPLNFDLYSALVVLPKMTCAEHESLEGVDTPEQTEKQLSGKQMGRMKAKKAVAARKEGMTTPASGDRDMKRLRSE